VTTRISKAVSHTPFIKFGVGGNVYVVCKSRTPLKNICTAIGKAQSSIYWSKKYGCYAFRIKQKAMKKRLAEV